MNDSELLKGSTAMLVLALLRRKTMYGYEIIKAMDESTAGFFRFKEGTLYPILHSLENSGCVEAKWEETESRRKRKYYSITEFGRKELKRREAEWCEFFSAVNGVLNGGLTYA
jgi:PadR family transcriptional regulator, regulatory protein PadR